MPVYIKCAQANLYTFREQWLFIKVYRFAYAHFNMASYFLFGQIDTEFCSSVVEDWLRSLPIPSLFKDWYMVQIVALFTQ